MTIAEFFEQLDARIAKYDLLRHPFYQAWSAGELSRENLQDYARDYYHHVEAFPTYLAELAVRLEECELRRAVLANMADEKGWDDSSSRPNVPHAELWLDFLEGTGASRDAHGRAVGGGVKELMTFFHGVASEGTPEEALAAFYAYESQVPRLAKEKARGLREIYGADERTCEYFTLHSTADVQHAQVWKEQLRKRVEADPESAESALLAGEAAAKALWRALDGIEAERMATAA